MRPERFAPLTPDDAALLYGELTALDEDRALSLAFVPDGARGAALSAARFFAEVAAIPARVSEPMLGAIRTQWWREALDEVFGGAAVRAHPLVRGLTTLRGAAVRAEMEAALDAVGTHLEDRTFETADEAIAAHAAFEGGCAAVIGALASGRALEEATHRRVRRLSGIAGVARALCVPPPPGRSQAIETPAQRTARSLSAGVDTHRTALRAALADARSGERLPDAALPALLPATLAQRYLTGKPSGPFGKRAAMTRAMLTGRV